MAAGQRGPDRDRACLRQGDDPARGGLRLGLRPHAAAERPVQAEGIGYITHPYPWKRSRPWEPKWEENFGFAAARYPIVASEIGFDNEQKDPAHAGYGEAIVDYLESKGVSWIAWVFDPEWHPQLIQSWETYAPTASGAFFSGAMKRPLPAQPVP